MERYIQTISGKCSYIFHKGNTQVEEKMIAISQEVPCPPSWSKAPPKDAVILVSNTNKLVSSLHLISHHSSDSDKRQHHGPYSPHPRCTMLSDLSPQTWKWHFSDLLCASWRAFPKGLRYGRAGRHHTDWWIIPAGWTHNGVSDCKRLNEKNWCKPGSSFLLPSLSRSSSLINLQHRAGGRFLGYILGRHKQSF